MSDNIDELENDIADRGARQGQCGANTDTITQLQTALRESSEIIPEQKTTPLMNKLFDELLRNHDALAEQFRTALDKPFHTRIVLSLLEKSCRLWLMKGIMLMNGVLINVQVFEGRRRMTSRC